MSTTNNTMRAYLVLLIYDRLRIHSCDILLSYVLNYIILRDVFENTQQKTQHSFLPIDIMYMYYDYLNLNF